MLPRPCFAAHLDRHLVLAAHLTEVLLVLVIEKLYTVAPKFELVSAQQDSSDFHFSGEGPRARFASTAEVPFGVIAQEVPFVEAAKENHLAFVGLLQLLLDFLGLKR